jgi:signal transduction histidine kinase
MLDYQGILYKNLRESRDESPRISPPLAELAQTKSILAVMEEELAETRYKLYKAQKEVEEMDRVKSEFIATVSHELRTPLNSIIGFAKLLLNQNIGPLNELQHTDLSIIYSSALHLQDLVNDILDLSKIDAGKIRLDKNWVTIEEIIVGVMPSTMLLIEDKPIELKEDLEPKLPQVYVDRGRIRQIVLNLLSNAAKFTDSGSIYLRIYQIQKDEQTYICFSVTDTGIGVAAEDADKVFEAFRQIDSSMGRRAEGTGLGLPISKRLARLHGGELWFESTLGRGSTFYFTIPVTPPENDKTDTTSVEAGA